MARKAAGGAGPSPTAAASGPAGRLRPQLGLLCHAILLVAPQCGLHKYLGSVWLNAAIAAGVLLLLYKLLTFHRWRDELPYAPRFGVAVLSLLSVIVVENFATWATSASDLRKHDYEPLQDNLEIALLWLFERYPAARWAVMTWRVDTHFLLYAFVALALSVVWDQVPHSGFGMAARFMDTIAVAHAIRTVAFLTTVLPNPRPRCYARSFPPVPDTVRGFVEVGFSAKRGSGCNDLVISGHGVVYAAVALALQTFYPLPAWRGGAGPLAWLAVLVLCLQETVDKTHYSVDMWLAVTLTALVWRCRAHVYPESERWAERPAGAPRDPFPVGMVAVVLGVLTLVFVGVAGT